MWTQPITSGVTLKNNKLIRYQSLAFQTNIENLSLSEYTLVFAFFFGKYLQAHVTLKLLKAQIFQEEKKINLK